MAKATKKKRSRSGKMPLVKATEGEREAFFKGLAWGMCIVLQYEAEEKPIVPFARTILELYENDLLSANSAANGTRQA